MNRGQRTGVASIEELEQFERLASSNFPQQYTIGPMPQCGFEKVTNGYSGYSVLLAACFEANQIGLGKLYLSGVFDQQDTFIGRNEFPKRVQKSRFPRSGPATNKQVAPLENVVFEPVSQRAG